MDGVRLNLGAGQKPLEGYDNSFDFRFDFGGGKPAHPLDVADASVDEIRASHIFEHFSHREALAVLRDWVRALKPGGLLKLAVPDFEKIAHGYLQGIDAPWVGYICGGHVDEHDVHLAQYDHDSLGALMRMAGLAGIHKWHGDGGDCSTLPISLNLAGWKPPQLPQVTAVMSMPRLAFTDNFFSAVEVVGKLRIPIQKTTGAFWGQCLTRSIERAIGEGAEWILALDYDTVYDAETVRDLIVTGMMSPQADALITFQCHRGNGKPLFTIAGPDGNPVSEIDRKVFDATLVPAMSGHFGCTLLRASKFAALERPWLIAQPDQDGRWGEARVDDDIMFWKRWRAAGNSMFITPRVVVGHAELQILWPDLNLEQLSQRPADYWKTGSPRTTWK